MKKIKLLVVLAMLVMFFSTCDEMIPSINDDPEEDKPEPTPVGFPNGLPVSKTIGPGGGVVSIEGEVEVEIPAGAVNADTEISIQPITNNALNGHGNAYRFGPDGTTFSKPVKLTFPYTPSVEGPPMTGVAFQDDDGIWYSNGKFSWNKVEKTVSTETTHFSDWATFDMLQIVCNACEVISGINKLKINESGEFKVNAISLDAVDTAFVGPLRKEKDNNAYDLVIKEWLANGTNAESMGPYGKIASSGAGCTYTAPAKVPSLGKNPVNLSVKLKNILYKDPATGVTFNDLQLSTAIEIIGDLKFELVIRYYSNDAVTGGLVGAAFIMKDSATVQVLAKGDGSIICSDTVNSPGVIIPTSKLDPTGNKSTCTSDKFLGPIHVKECSGIWTTSPDGHRVIQFIVTGDSEMPAFDWVSALGGKVSFPKSTGGMMQIFYFELTGDIPIWKNPNEIMTAKLVPKE
jgi:hypothetical protein